MENSHKSMILFFINEKEKYKLISCKSTFVDFEKKSFVLPSELCKFNTIIK